MKLENVIEIAKLVAIKSSHRHKMSCVIFDKKRIISFEYNEAHTVRRNLKPSQCRYKYSLHCEQAAILSAKTDLRGKSMLVIRINKNGELRYSRPCEKCMEYIERVSIRSLYFVNRDGLIERIKL